MASMMLRRAAPAALVAMLVGAGLAGAQDSCTPPGMSGQCNDMGSIVMDFQRDVVGDPIDVTARIVLNSNYREAEVRSFMFSVRNTTTDGSPVSIALKSITTADGPVQVKMDRPGPNEVTIWVDVLDVPVGTPIDLTVGVGVSERGAFRLEVLVMPFDRAYHPLKDSAGNDRSLFAFTLLAVNRESASATEGPGSIIPTNSVVNKLPGFEAPLLGLAALGALLVLRAPPRRPRAGSTTLPLFRKP